MSSYSATMLVKDMSGNLTTATGSFGNICIDGRHTENKAIEVARKEFQSEAEFKNQEYLGFAIEKIEKFVNYKEPRIVDNNVKVSDVSFLL